MLYVLSYIMGFLTLAFLWRISKDVKIKNDDYELQERLRYKINN